MEEVNFLLGWSQLRMMGNFQELTSRLLSDYKGDSTQDVWKQNLPNGDWRAIT